LLNTVSTREPCESMRSINSTDISNLAEAKICLSVYLPTYLPTYLSIHPSIYLPTYLSMALQPFVRTWLLFHFLNPSARRKTATYTQNNTNTEQAHADIHALSGIRTHVPSVRAGEGGSCRRPHRHCDEQRKRSVT
jgi:hypothetical protein